MTIAVQTKSVPAIRPHLWTREEFDNMVLAGIFQPEARLELIEGEILEMGTQSSWHATAVQLVQDTLRNEYGKDFVIRNQMPLAISDDSEPVPDIAVVIGSPRDYREEHPTTAVLIVEVSRSTLDYDRGRKLRLYARCGIPDYWILNVVDMQLEIYRDPVDEGYRTQQVFYGMDAVSLLSHPDASIPVADLLP